MNWTVVAALNLALAVMFGAFGAHGLKDRLSVDQLKWWETATHYFFYHALGLLIVSILVRLYPALSLRPAAGLLQLGIVLFCGSLYLMALGAPRWFGAITPLGGLALIAGWVWLAWQARTR
jgi:uncharacterized membrane protein YgdD (TMEM256/DUF423 family)